MNRRTLSPSTPRSRAMDKYEQLAVVGEGSYGVVLKCRRRDTGQLVAIKKFLETEDDAAVRKMALREIRMLKKLRHDHLVNMIEVFRRKRRFYLVFEYLDHTLLDELEATSGGLGEDTAKKHLYQLLKGIDYCHQNSIIHRDVKPENVLVSNNGIVKLCDLGFARALAAPGEPYTEYVATRWYRAPELLVAEHRYGPEVDIWAMGCLFAEMLTGDPLFPGDSDIDQLALIIKIVEKKAVRSLFNMGPHESIKPQESIKTVFKDAAILTRKLAPRHQQVVSRLSGARPPPRMGGAALPGAARARDLLAACLRTEPRARPAATALLRHKYFATDGFAESFNAELRKKLGKEIETPPPQQGTARVAGKPRQQWTLNIISDQSRSRTNSTAGESLIDYNYTPNNEDKLETAERKSLQPQSTQEAEEMTLPWGTSASGVLVPSGAVSKAGGTYPGGTGGTYQAAAGGVYPVGTGIGATGAGGAGAGRPTLPRSLARAIDETFQTFPVPVNTYPRTPYIKKVNGKLVMDEELLRGKKASKKTAPEFSLPYVPGASNSPVKKAKKPQAHNKSYDNCDSSNITPNTKTPTNLPYM